MQLQLDGIRNIIFDLGAVIINIDYHRTVKAFSDIGIPNFDQHYSKATQQDLFDRFETGKISSAEFRSEIKKLHPPLENQQIDEAWNAMLLDLPLERLELLTRLKETHRTFLLSNTNEIHTRKINEYLQETYQIPHLKPFFEKTYLSHEVGMRKPNAEIFEKVLTENQLLPGETLFIDDSPQHINGAASVGIITCWLQHPVTVTDIFKATF